MAAALKELRPGVRVYGVEPTGAAAMALAFAAGAPITINPVTVADGLAAPFAGALTLAMCRRYLDGLVELDDPTILAGVRFALERMKQVLEPAGAAALAAVLFGRIPIRDGERVLALASGGNIDVAPDRAAARRGRAAARATGPDGWMTEPPLTPPPVDPRPRGGADGRREPSPIDPPPPRLPGSLEIVSRGLDLAVAASAHGPPRVLLRGWHVPVCCSGRSP